MATLQPVKKRAWKDPKDVLAGKIKFPGDLATIDTSDLWDVVRNPDDWGI